MLERFWGSTGKVDGGTRFITPAGEGTLERFLVLLVQVLVLTSLNSGQKAKSPMQPHAECSLKFCILRAWLASPCSQACPRQTPGTQQTRRGGTERK